MSAEGLSSVPEWLATAVLGAGLAALGYLAKTISELVGGQVAATKARRARLAELLALIRAGDAAFRVQCDVRDRLSKLIVEREPTIANLALDQRFSAAFPSMTPVEQELFDVMRAYTVYTIKPLNDALLRWLAADSDFRIGLPGRSPRAKLAAYLGDLEAHLLLWQAKYSAWIPDHPERALVYLAGESKHGTPFPKDGAAIVHALLHRGGALPPNSGLQKR